MEKPTTITKAKNQVITHIYHDGAENRREEKFSLIRGGLSWPVDNYPGYFCIIGERYLENIDHTAEDKKRGELVFFEEYEDSCIPLDEFFHRLTDAAKAWGCSTFYTVPYDTQNEYFRELGRFTSRVGSPVRTETAPAAGAFHIGVSYIQKWAGEMGLLDLPQNSIVAGQLRGFSLESFAEKPERFHAVNGLRYVLASIHQYPEGHTVFAYRPPQYPGGSTGWMGF